MHCAPGDWIETATVIALVTRVLAPDLIQVYDFERHAPRVVATQRGCQLLACVCGARHDSVKGNER